MIVKPGEIMSGDNGDNGEGVRETGTALVLRQAASRDEVLAVGTRINRELDLRVEALTKLFDERDRRYTERADEAKAAAALALVELDKRTTLAFSASERAITKAEEAQREYNIRSNEFRGQLDDQAKTLISRSEAEAQFRALDEKIEARYRTLEEKLETRFNTLNGKIEELKKEIIPLRDFQSNTQGRMWALACALLIAEFALNYFKP